MELMGIDIGGSGIKGAPVAVETGKLTGERFRLKTPQPASPEAMVEVIAQVIAHFEWKGAVGVGFPGIVKRGVAYSAANLDKAWIGKDVAAMISKASGCPTAVVNDADAAGIAEARFGAGRGKQGTVIVLTLGTGIGSAIFLDGRLLPNSELGHLRWDDKRIAEDVASDRAREQEKLKWKDWAPRVEEYLKHLERLFSPDLFILGGGVSKKFDKFSKHLSVETPVVPAELRNLAGIVGAAMAAADLAPRA